jgi:long-chain acyl-CoA synthetase
MYGVLPMSHIVGLSNILTSFLMFGATIQVVPRYEAADLVRAVEDDDISMLFGVPATFQRLLEYEATAGLATLPRGRPRNLAVAGAPLDGTLRARIEQEFGLPLMNGYGITECGPSISGVRPSAPRNDTGVGAPVSPCVSSGATGHLWSMAKLASCTRGGPVSCVAITGHQN